MKHPKLVSKCLALAWLPAYTGLVMAAPTTFAQDVYGFDYESLAWAAAAGLMGGMWRTVFYLGSDNVAVVFLWRQMLKDVILALASGAFAYLFVSAAATRWPDIFSREVRMVVIVLAGYSRGKWREWMFQWAADWFAGQRAKARGGAAVAPPDPPSAPLG